MKATTPSAVTLAESTQDSREVKELTSPDGNVTVLMKTIGSPHFRAGYEDVDKDVCNAFYGLMVKPGASPTQPSLKGANIRISLEDDEVMLVTPLPHMNTYYGLGHISRTAPRLSQRTDSHMWRGARDLYE